MRARSVGRLGRAHSIGAVSAYVVVETLVYDATRDRLVWRATSETKDPKDLQHFITDLVTGTVKEMKKMKLVR